MQTFTLDDGRRVPVRDGFLLWPENYRICEEITTLDRWGANAELTEREHIILAAYTNRRNIHSALAWIAPHTFTDLGFETACQVHGNRARFTCGCEVHYVFDHHLRTRPHGYARFELRPFRAPTVCKKHRKINDLEALFDAASASGRKKPK